MGCRNNEGMGMTDVRHIVDSIEIPACPFVVEECTGTTHDVEGAGVRQAEA